jgi:hypothetical protein
MLRYMCVRACVPPLQNLLLVAKAQRSEELTRDSLQKLEMFEKDMRFVAADKVRT